jgi:hypothetical protein
MCQQDDTLRKAVEVFKGRNWKKIGCLFFSISLCLYSVVHIEIWFHAYLSSAVYRMIVNLRKVYESRMTDKNERRHRDCKSRNLNESGIARPGNVKRS